MPMVDAAALAGKTWSQMWQLVLTRKVKGWKKDGRWVVDSESFRAYEAARAQSASDPEAA